jgi:hypothetical protein
MVGILYYSSNELDETPLNDWCRSTIQCSGLPITSSTQLPINLGNNVLYGSGKRIGRSHTILYKQILKGLKAAKEDYLFFCEHDVLYHPSHFDFLPPRDDTFYYDGNVVKYRLSDRKVVTYDCKWLSMLCASRELLIDHYEKRLEMIDAGKKAYGYEPGAGQSRAIDDAKSDKWYSEGISIDVRHGGNWTGVQRMDTSEFRNKKTCQDFRELNINNLGWDTERLLSL